MTDGPATSSARQIKTRLRQEARAAVARMSRDARRTADVSIVASLRAYAARRAAHWILAYLSLPDEVSLDALACELVEEGREVWLPRVSSGRLRLGRWRPATELSRDAEGVLAPARDSMEGWPDGSGLVLVPGRAFDRTGGRVGRGRGYYDRLLADRPGRAVAIGVAYECQVVEVVPRELHDHDVDLVVTESATSFAAAWSNARGRGLRGVE